MEAQRQLGTAFAEAHVSIQRTLIRSPKKRTSPMLTTRPCTAICVIDGMPLTVTFYPDNGVLRIANSLGTCIKETRWHASWRALLDELRGFTEGAAMEGQRFNAMVGRFGERAEHPLDNMALA
jgi:hypothetical protein